MKIKKIVSAVCLALGLALTVPAAASFQSGSPSIVFAADGWQQDDTGWYYLKNDQRLTGLRTINNAKYYFDTDGYRQTGIVKLDQKAYFFNPGTGRLCTGIKGLSRLADTNDFYYFLKQKDGSVAVNQWITHKGKKYYAGSDGKLLFGTVRVKSKLYHLTPDGMMTDYGRSSYNNKYYYATAKGPLKTGMQNINGKLYYFSTSNGMRQTGLIKVGKRTYYFDKSTGAAARGCWKKLSGKYYYFNKKGQRMAGMQTLNGKKYYLDPSANGARATSRWVKYNNAYYYFDAKGQAVTGLFKLPDGNVYYANSKAVRQTGWQTIGGRKYYFSPDTGAMQTGWFYYGDKTYYMNPSSLSKYYGAAVTGWLIGLNGENYYFNTDGTLKKGCWIYDSGAEAYYYLDPDTGKVLKGTQYIDGKWYNLGTTGAYKKPISGEMVIKVNRALNCITVYRGDVPIKAFVCSTSKVWGNTPKGTFKLLDKLRWHELLGPSYGQYCSHITSDILFHSVPSTAPNLYSLEYWEYNKLGTAASAGCIRMTVAGAKWLYDNCPKGTKVIIYDDWNSPGPLGKPSAPYAPNWNKYYDPTDPLVPANKK